MMIKEAFNELAEDLKNSLPGKQIFWDSEDLKFGIRLTLDYLGITKNKIKFYLTVQGGDCFNINSFIEIAELEQLIFTKLPFFADNQQKYPRKLENCSYFVTIFDETADREKKETINYSRRFLLTCEITK